MKKSFLFFTRSLYCLKIYIILLIFKRHRLNPIFIRTMSCSPITLEANRRLWQEKRQAQSGYMQLIFNPEALGCFDLYCKAKLHHLTTHCLFFQLVLKIFTLTPPSNIRIEIKKRKLHLLSNEDQY